MMHDEILERDIKRHTDWEPSNWYEYYYYSIEDTISLPEVKTKEQALEALMEIVDYYSKAYCDIQDMPDGEE